MPVPTSGKEIRCNSSSLGVGLDVPQSFQDFRRESPGGARASFFEVGVGGLKVEIRQA
ncbi:MAG TPA: hypothetical protein VHC97_04085 [Thermoanaerobaculia bacterium]|nr:hypothetical protein [Thermoanaerobaculia bacterium]